MERPAARGNKAGSTFTAFSLSERQRQRRRESLRANTALFHADGHLLHLSNRAQVAFGRASDGGFRVGEDVRLPPAPVDLIE